MEIEVKVGYPLDKVLDRNPIAVSITDGASVAEILDHLITTYPDLGPHLRGEDTNSHVPFNYFVNRKVVRDQALATTFLKEGDRLHILLPVVGG